MMRMDEKILESEAYGCNLGSAEFNFSKSYVAEISILMLKIHWEKLGFVG